MSNYPQGPGPQQFLPPGWNGAPPPVPTRRSRKGLWILLGILGGVLVIGMVVGSIFAVRSLTAAPSPRPSPTEDADPDPNNLGTNNGDVFAERDRFRRDQPLPTGDSPVKAVTPEQKEFIARMKSEYASQGANWTNKAESLALVMTSDACEASILNSHSLDEAAVRSHVSASPFIAYVVGQAPPDKRVAVTNAMARTLVTGTEYMCPDDHPQWQAAFDAINGDW